MVNLIQFLRSNDQPTNQPTNGKEIEEIQKLLDELSKGGGKYNWVVYINDKPITVVQTLLSYIKSLQSELEAAKDKSLKAAHAIGKEIIRYNKSEKECSKLSESIESLYQKIQELSSENSDLLEKNHQSKENLLKITDENYELQKQRAELIEDIKKCTEALESIANGEVKWSGDTAKQTLASLNPSTSSLLDDE